ncbi:MAG TPA: methylated-DNA--[protein]-cysteine S-methyltransferase [Verrucomicrobiae bacterium]|nr:methylated-DNA--[protein]-cysteine S-methyltransferase [Verrucomicrobiae bacterium]
MKTYMILKTEVVGELLLTAENAHLTGIYFNDCSHSILPARGARLDPENPVLQQAAEELQEYLGGARTTFTVPLFYSGTGLQEAVWREIARIPFGETITYTELALRAHAAGAVRAVGTATGQNPIGIIIPCHRVMGKDGKLRGYAGGLERKRHLLALENKVAGLELISEGLEARVAS